MKNLTKYYSYNQVIENFDVLIMTEQEYLANKDKLDNPQRVVIVNRAGGPKEPKAPKWFTIWCKEKFDPLVKRIETIENILERNNLH